MSDVASRTPRLRAGCEIRSLPISPREAFLLSRIDGSTTESELGELTGFDHQTVRTVVDRLESLGVIEFARAAAENLRSTSSALKPGVSSRTSQTQFKAVTANPRDLEEDVQLDREKKGKILEMLSQLERLDYYGLLGVSENADRKEIKRSYYAVAPDYHPDRFYGKNLGSFKGKMETIFAQLTFAYETLSSADKRAEYDLYLATQKRTRKMEELLRDGALSAASNAELETFPGPAQMSSRPPIAHRSEPAARPGSEPSALKPSDPALPNQTPGPQRTMSAARSLDDDRARRAALARKLVGRSSLPPEARASAPPTSGSTAGLEAAASELKRRHGARVGDPRPSQVQRYVDAAKEALSTNPAAAANAYRLALTLDPQNGEIAVAHQHAAKLAAVALADGYLKQGDYESRAGQWIEAARSYTRAAAGMPNDAAVLQKAAQALVKSAGDMHKAADLAKRAVALLPKGIETRLVLIEVYLAAKLPLAARREIEAAREIAPHDDRVSELFNRLK